LKKYQKKLDDSQINENKLYMDKKVLKELID
jgi:hypothetical protein